MLMTLDSGPLPDRVRKFWSWSCEQHQCGFSIAHPMVTDDKRKRKQLHQLWVLPIVGMGSTDDIMQIKNGIHRMQGTKRTPAVHKNDYGDVEGSLMLA